MEFILMGPSISNRPMTGRVWYLCDLLDKMLERYGASAAAARLDAGEGLLDARARCYRCRAAVDCEEFLAAAEERAAIPPFCPNAAFLQCCLDKGPSPGGCKTSRAG